jgi:Condensation domain/AMP-binding enzyme
MNLSKLLAALSAKSIRLRRNGDDLVLQGKAKLDAATVAALRAHKPALLELIGQGSGDGDGGWWAPAAPAAAELVLTPEMVPLVRLTQVQLDRIVAAVPGGARNIADLYPLAPLQEGVLFHHLLAEEGDPYLLASAGTFDQRGRAERFLAALRQVIARHDVLRTAVLWEGLPEPVQVVLRQAELPVEELQLDPAAGDVAAQLRARFDPRRFRLDVRRAPLLRAYLAEDRAAGRWVVMLLLHHLAGDHTTLELLQEEVTAFLLGEGEALPPSVPFRDYVAQTLLAHDRAAHEAFFRAELGELDEPTAPFGLVDAHGDGRGVAEASLPVAPELARRMRERSRRLGVSVASLCHLAWALVVERTSGRTQSGSGSGSDAGSASDAVFGTVLFGRMHGASSGRALGLYMNTLPLRVRLLDEPVDLAVRRTHAALAALMQHEHASLAQAIAQSGVTAPAPLFTSLLNYRHSGGGAAAPAEQVRRAARAWEGAEALPVEEYTNYPVTLSIDDDGEGFALTAQVAGQVSPRSVCRLMHQALAALTAALEAPAAGGALPSVHALDLLPEEDRQQLAKWNDTAAEIPPGCVHQLFERQAALAPDAVALVSGERTLRYGELNARANRLAHHLRALGVSADVPVAVCLPRGIELVVSLLAVLKAGGAYVPLDPSYPADRVAHILDDSRPVALLTSAALPAVPRPAGLAVVEPEV